MEVRHVADFAATRSTTETVLAARWCGRVVWKVPTLRGKEVMPW